MNKIAMMPYEPRHEIQQTTKKMTFHHQEIGVAFGLSDRLIWLANLTIPVLSQSLVLKSPCLAADIHVHLLIGLVI